MEKGKDPYQEVIHQIKKIFEDHVFPLELELRKQYSGPLLEKLRSLNHGLLQIGGADDEKDRRQVSLLLEGLPELHKEVLFREADHYSRLWEKHVESLLDVLPQNVETIQSDERFSVETTDSYRIRWFKMMKKRLYKAGSRLSRKPEKVYCWSQKIPLRAVLRQVLLHEKSVFRELAADAAMIRATALEKLFDETLAAPDITTETALEQPDEQEVQAGSRHISKNRQLSVALLDGITEKLRSAIRNLEAYQDPGAPASSKLYDAVQRAVYLAERAGTVEYPESSFRKRRYRRRAESIQKETSLLEEQWQKLMESQISDLQIQLELAQFGVVAREVRNRLSVIVKDLFEKRYRTPLRQSLAVLKEYARQLQASESPEKAGEMIGKIREKLEEDVSEPSVPVLQDQAQEDVFLDDIRRQIGELEWALNRFSKKIRVADKRDISGNTPVISTKEFNWADVAGRFLKQEALFPLDPGRQDLVTFRLKQVHAVEEVVNIVEVNLQAALTSQIREGAESLMSVALSGVERAIFSMQKALESVDEHQEKYLSLLADTLPAAFEKLEKVLLARSFESFILRDRAMQVKARALSWREKWIRAYALAQDHLEHGLLLLKEKYQEFGKPLLKYLGIAGADDQKSRDKQTLAQTLIRSTTLPENLPFVYQRLFNRRLQIDRRFYVDPHENLALLVEGYRHWKNNMDWNVAVVGQKGSGKSTLISFFREEIDSHQPIMTLSVEKTLYSKEELILAISEKLGYSHVAGLEDLISQIRASRRKKVMIFEGLQNIYIRNINGYEAIRTFWVLMSQTTGHLFWVVTCSSSAWDFFARMFEAGRSFSQVLRTDRISDEMMEEGIMARHRATGYELEILPNDRIVRTRAYKKLLGKETAIQELLRKEFINQLARIADGNFSVAMIFWLQSVREWDHTRFVMAMRQSDEMDLEDISSREILFALASLMRHDTLTAGEMAKVLHQSISESKTVLGQLKANGLIIETANGFTINQLVYRQISRLLYSKNILH